MHLVVKDGQLNNAEQRLAEEFCNCPALSHRLRDKLIRRVVEVHRLAAELHRLDRSADGRGASGDRRTGQRRVADGHRTWPPPDSARRRPETQTELAPAELPVQQIAARSLEVYEQPGKVPCPRTHRCRRAGEPSMTNTSVSSNSGFQHSQTLLRQSA